MRIVERLGNRFGVDKSPHSNNEAEGAQNAQTPTPVNNAGNTHQQEVDDTKQRGGIGHRVHGIRTLIPGYEYDLSTSQGRHDYMENLFTRYGRIINFIPFILILAVSTTNPTAAIWSAFGINMFVVFASMYRSKYNKKVPFIPIITLGITATYLGEGIANQILTGGLSSNLIAPVTCSGVFITAIFSMIICIPFTIQNTRLFVSEEEAKTWDFVKFNQILTSIWVLIFLLMTISSWCGHIFFRNDVSGAPYIVLGIVVPIILVVIGMLITAPIAKCLKDSRNNDKKEDVNDKKDLEHDAVDEEEKKGMLEYGEHE